MRVSRRIATVVAGVLFGAFALAGVAAAHVEVSGKPARALALDAVVTFDAEAESTTVGISSVRVVLPEGITPADVTPVSGPNGWTLTATDDGYMIGGRALPVGTNAVYAIKVRQLPNARSIAFKTLVTYSDGKIDRWIEVPQAGEKEPANPAPVLKLAAAASGATTVTSTVSPSPSVVATTDAAPATTAGAATATATTDDGGTSSLVWVVIGLIVVALGVGMVIARRRRE